MGERFVLVTGSSTGIGKACALYLAKRGFSVIAGVRRGEDAKNLELIAGGNLQGILLDIADSGSIGAAAKRIAQITGESGLAGIVNNAGISVPGPVEFISREDWRRQFEVNVFGQAELTRELLPLVRRHVAGRGHGAGRIVFIGSIAGRIAMPISGPYSASKHAIAAIVAALRMELREQGIHVCLIEPGAIQSEIWRKGIEFAATIAPDAPPRELYGRQIDAAVGSARNSAAGAIGADRVARVVWRCLSSPRPPIRKTVGRDAMLAAVLKRVLPEKWFDEILLRALKIR
ncbi:MAG: SDR family oxidoreductase [Tepidisphaeraceae bacterium]|jgi:NAD(P)-dependent dehydrogenase (short-subunit alcohol dehydrogenase family)